MGNNWWSKTIGRISGDVKKKFVPCALRLKKKKEKKERRKEKNLAHGDDSSHLMTSKRFH